MYLSTVTLMRMFFALLFVGLLFGDGKQGAIEVFGVSVTMVSLLYARLHAISLQRLPTSIFLPWVALGASAAVSSLMSDSVGFSLSWMIRLSSGYLVYRLFSSIASPETIRDFVKSSFVFVAAAAGLSIVSQAHAPVRDLLPSMNLIDLRYGHNHLADLLVFIFPIVLSLAFFSRRSIANKLVVVAGYIFFLIFTLARGAWFAVGACSAAFVFTHTNKRLVRAWVIAPIVVLVGIFGYGATRAHTPNNDNADSTHITSRTIRPFTLQIRLEYWRQATESVKERPLFGSGPGTFSLTSQRLQRRQNQSSWFAHSFFLETASEMGMVGATVLAWFMVAHGLLYVKRKKIFQKSRAARALVWGLMATAIYGLYEFTLSYHVVWLLFWAGTGLITGMAQDRRSSIPIKHVSMLIPLVLISLFYVMWMTSGFVVLTSKRYDTAFYLAPFDAGNASVALAMYNDQSGRTLNTMPMRLFHKNNPVVLKGLAAYYTRQHQDQDAIEMLSRVIRLDPKSLDGYVLYDLARARVKEPLDFIGQTQMLVDGFLPKPISKRFDTILSRSAIKDSETILPRLDMNQLTELTIEESLSTVIYLVGYGVVDTDKDAALSLWELSSEIDPNLSFYAVERANLLAREGNLDAALSILDQCQTNRFAKRHCSDFRQQLIDKTYLPVGFFADHMRESLPFTAQDHEEQNK